jgi:hypothetical protein
MVDYTAMRQSLLAVFGEPVQVMVGAVTSPLTAAYLAPYQGMDVGGVPVSRPNPQFMVDAAEWDVVGANRGDTITRNGTVYTIVDAQPTDDGLTTINVRRYA